MCTYTLYMYKGFLLLLLFIGIILVIIELSSSKEKEVQEKIVYRYIPRTFDEEQNEPVYPSDIFRTMFTQPSTWIGETTDLDTRKRESINRFFISQM